MFYRYEIWIFVIEVFILISLVSVLADITSGLSPLEIRSSYSSIHFSSIPKSSSPVSTRITSTLINTIYWPRNRSSPIILSLNIMPGRRGILYIFRTRDPRNTRLLFIYTYWLATLSLKSA